MIIRNRVKLDNKNYYIECDCEYKSKNDLVQLCLKNYKDNYYDGGDLSKLILTIEKKYNDSSYKKYDKENWFLSDCLYIYDNIPFIKGVGDFYLSSNDGMINSISYISCEELDEYIKSNHIKMNDNNNFKLYDEATWNINK